MEQPKNKNQRRTFEGHKNIKHSIWRHKRHSTNYSSEPSNETLYLCTASCASLLHSVIVYYTLYSYTTRCTRVLQAVLVYYTLYLCTARCTHVQF